MIHVFFLKTIVINGAQGVAAVEYGERRNTLKTLKIVLF